VAKKVTKSFENSLLHFWGSLRLFNREVRNRAICDGRATLARDRRQAVGPERFLPRNFPMRGRAEWVGRYVTLAMAVALSVGCGGETERAPIFGTLIGAAGRDGVITVAPAQGNEGPSGTTQIVGGEFKFDADSGPAPGAYIARIRLAPAPGARLPAAAAAAVAAATAGGKQPDKIPNRATFGRDPLLPVAEEREISITVPKAAPWKLDIPWQ
jgi:hypothetical protein